MEIFDLVKEFHKLYAKYKKPEYLQIAAELGKHKPEEDFEKVWQRKVNAGCVRDGLPLMYQDVDKSQ